MILVAALLAMQVAAPPAEDEIVVIARNFARVKVNIGFDRQHHMHCSLSGTSGNLNLDEKLCRATAKCVRKVGTDSPAIRQCVEDKKPKLLADFRKEWQRSHGK